MSYRLPHSPYDLRQEQTRDNQWQMLIICMMLNQTNFKQVEKVRYQFFDRFPDADALVNATDAEIIEIIKPLGFYNRRAQQWKKFSQQWLEVLRRYEEPLKIPVTTLAGMAGIGKYALDSWKIFQLYDYSVEPEDHALNWYIDWARAYLEQEKRTNSDYRPIVVYYLHYNDAGLRDQAFSKRQDFTKCVLARTNDEAIEKVKALMPGKHIKILGVAAGLPEWLPTA